MEWKVGVKIIEIRRAQSESGPLLAGTKYKMSTSRFFHIFSFLLLICFSNIFLFAFFFNIYFKNDKVHTFFTMLS